MFWYKNLSHQSGGQMWQGPKQVGQKWQDFKHIFAGSDQVIYAIKNDGTLLMYKHVGQENGNFSWDGAPKQAGSGWESFKHVFGGTDGLIYAIEQDGTLFLYHNKKHAQFDAAWEAPKKVGNGWESFKHVFGGTDGLIYAIEQDGTLLLYYNKKHAQFDAAWEAPKKVGNGWEDFKHVFGGGSDGVVYAIRQDGTLCWYKNVQHANFGGRWEGPEQVGNGWAGFKHVFGGPNGIIYAVSTRCLNLHFKILTEPNFDRLEMVTAAREVFNRLLINIDIRSTEILDLPNLEQLDVGPCNKGILTNDIKTLFGNRRNVNPNEVVAYFVDSLLPSASNLIGCAVHPFNQPGFVLTKEQDNRWTLAHELGHVLGLRHPEENINKVRADLMEPKPAVINSSPYFEDKEKQTILSSNLIIQY
ncbi:MAG: hypothetical protein KC423_01305 [Anaerolineales bacterium]|nr:hypothetical protein [Anaerolineales bacterium]